MTDCVYSDAACKEGLVDQAYCVGAMGEAQRGWTAAPKFVRCSGSGL